MSRQEKREKRRQEEAAREEKRRFFSKACMQQPYDVIIFHSKKAARDRAVSASQCARGPTTTTTTNNNTKPTPFNIWIDGSLGLNCSQDGDLLAGAAVVYKVPGSNIMPYNFQSEWRSHAFAVSGIEGNPRLAELAAAKEALRIVLREWMARNYEENVGVSHHDDQDWQDDHPHDPIEDADESSQTRAFTKARLFTDCQDVLYWLAERHNPLSTDEDSLGPMTPCVQKLRTQIKALARELNAHGVHLELNWVPAHAGVEGNERADGMAKAARAYIVTHRSEIQRGLEGGQPQVLIWELDQVMLSRDSMIQLPVE